MSISIYISDNFFDFMKRSPEKQKLKIFRNSMKKECAVFMFSKNDNQISNLPFFVKVKPCFDKLYCGFQEQVSLQNFSNLL